MSFDLDHNGKERIAADILIAAIQAKGANGGGFTIQEITENYQAIYEQVYSAHSVASEKAKMAKD